MTTKIITGESLEITSSPAYYTPSAATLAGHLSGIDDRLAFTDDGILSFEYVQRLGSETYAYSLADLGSGVVLAGTGQTGQVYKSTDSRSPTTAYCRSSTSSGWAAKPLCSPWPIWARESCWRGRVRRDKCTNPG